MNLRRCAMIVCTALPILVSSSKGFALSIKNAKEILAFYSSVFTINSEDTDVKRSYLALKPRLPIRGEVGEFNASALLAYTELAGVFCQKFVASEASRVSGRVVHDKVDFNKGPSALSREIFQGIIIRYADLMWERAPSAKEQEILMTSFETMKKTTADNAAGTYQILKTTCASISTSIESLIYL